MSWKLREVPKCGTPRGYDYHTRQLREEPCSDCRKAKADQWKEKRARNKDRLNSWRRENRKDPIRAQYEKDSSRRRSGAFVGDYSHKTVLETYGAVCYLCEGKIDTEAPRQVGKQGWELGLHIDHIIPISKGGEDNLANVRPAHGYCNQRKGASC
jgi:5-methylcytosine-specific restriction endonuclease McrA